MKGGEKINFQATMSKKTPFIIGSLMSLIIGILAITNKTIENSFFPFAIFFISLIELTEWNGLLKAACSQGLIAGAGLMTGIFIGFNPVFIPGLSYFLISVSIPLAIIAVNYYREYQRVISKKP